MKTGKRIFLKGCALFGLAILGSCSTSRDTAASRGMQNLTARYNILYNARILIDAGENAQLQTYRDDYTLLIPVFREPAQDLAGKEDRDLDKAIEKLNVIINEKASSQYVDDAYFQIARANHLKGRFFTAAELFDYLFRSYRDDREKTVATLAWKARSLSALQKYDEASAALDSAEKYLKPKSRAAATVYACRAQLHLTAGRDSLAISFLEKARTLVREKSLKLRWTFLLAQLQEQNGRPEAARQLYTSVIRSNAPFELAFSAQLNRIALQQENDPRETGRIGKLAALLKADKNKAFRDRIYYEIGKAYAAQQEPEKAVESFNRSLEVTTGNQEQKGLTYLSLAELYFNGSRYERSRLYFDSTLSVLPPSHPLYAGVHKKATNLDLLTSQLSLIAKEDTLQMLAALSGPERESRIAGLISGQAAAPSAPDFSAGSPAVSAYRALATEGTFYFNNSAALGQGYSEFRRRWGNRKLEDNWRSSQKSSVQMASSGTMSPPNPDEPASPVGSMNAPVKTAEELRQDYLDHLPVTPALKAESDQRIERAYEQIAGFYRDILEDRHPAILSYRQILNRFPDTRNKPVILYQLYRLYSETDSVARATEIRNLLLREFPETPFTKTIVDPEYGKRQNDSEAALTEAYDAVYRLFDEGKFADVLSRIKQVKEAFPGNRLLPQLSYLEALSTGHLQRLPAFEAKLNDLISSFPADSLVTPLAKLHLDYIEKNRSRLANRPYAILETDGSETSWSREDEAGIKGAAPAVAEAPAEREKAMPAENRLPGESGPVAGRFSLKGSATYYFVVNVDDGRANLSSSRFGIGQFNRTKYASAAIKHQLKRVNNQNQLIFVGPFANREEAALYHRDIMPVMSQIMKVSADRFSTFIITQEDLAELEDREDLEKYIEFYHNTLNERSTE